MNLNTAGNVLVPAYLVLLTKGYVVTCEHSGDGSENWIAEGALGRFSAEDIIALLGLVAIAETRGTSWCASDSEIDAFFKKFGGPRGG